MQKILLVVLIIAIGVKYAEGAKTCNEYCNSLEKGDGAVVGTATSCGATCENSCKTKECKIHDSGASDYGGKCLSGNKVCCCEKNAASKLVPILLVMPLILLLF